MGRSGAAKVERQEAQAAAAKKKGKNAPEVLLLAWSALTQLLATMVDRFGWPGAGIMVAVIFVELHGTADQKKEIINRFILGKGISDFYPTLIVGVVGLLLFGAQHVYWRRRETLMQKEVNRLAAWKTAHQQKALGTDLHHTKKPEKG